MVQYTHHHWYQYPIILCVHKLEQEFELTSQLMEDMSAPVLTLKKDIVSHLSVMVRFYK